jgi:hypothetical protein
MEQTMFYKNSSRSTVLERAKTQRNDHVNAVEESAADARVLEGIVMPAKPVKAANARLSPFERELLQAWAQD